MSRKHKSSDGPKLEEYIGLYTRHKNKRDELEVRFGTKYYNPITKKCVVACKDGKERNNKFRCVKTKKQTRFENQQKN